MALINKLSAIGEAIREKTGKEGLLTLDEMPQAIKDIESGGGDSYYDTFWDGWTNNGTRTPSNPYQFREWTEEMFYPKYDLVFTNGQNLFHSTTMNIDLSKRLKDCGVSMDTSKMLYASGMFIQSAFTRIPFISFEKAMINQAINSFNSCKQLVILDGIKVLREHKYNGAFNMCFALTTIERIEGEIGNSISFINSSNLDDGTIQRIIDVLEDKTGADSQILTFHETVKAKLTDDQIAQITNKNWTLA